MTFAHISTRDVAPEKRLQRWNEITGRFFPGMVVDGPDELVASWHSLRLGDTHICLARAPQSKVSRWTNKSTISETGRAHFQLQIRGVTQTQQDNRSVVCASGEMTVCHSDMPYQLDISRSNECVVIDTKAELFDFEALWMKILTPDNCVHVRLLTAFIHNLLGQDWDQETLSADEAQSLETVLQTLLRNCSKSGSVQMPEPSGSSGTEDLGMVYQNAVMIIERHLDDSGFRTSQIAQKIGVPVHVVQKAFAQFGTTPTAFLQSLRLAKAQHYLQDPSHEESLTGLAHRLGFSDAAHFCRRFKARYKMTPSSFQKMYRSPDRLSS